MNTKPGFGRSLIHTLLVLAGSGAMTWGGASLAGCGGRVTVDLDGGEGAASSTAGSGGGGGADSGLEDCAPTEPMEQWACFAIDVGTGCPDPEASLSLLDEMVCATSVVCKSLGNNFPNEQCCYVVTVEPC